MIPFHRQLYESYFMKVGIDWYRFIETFQESW